MIFILLRYQSVDLFSQDRVSRAIVLALAVCYYARIQEIKMRNDYVRETSKAFRRPLENMDPKIFVGEINR